MISVIHRRAALIGLGLGGVFAETRDAQSQNYGDPSAPNTAATLAAAQEAALRGDVLAGSAITILGHTSAGDGGGFLGMVESQNVPHYPGGGRIKPVASEVYPEWWGARPDASADAAFAFEAAFDYLTKQRGGLLHAHGKYRFDSTCTIGDPNNISVDARGARFVTRRDILMFDCNGRADPSYQDNTSVQNFWWLGGSFDCTAERPTKASALRLYGFRNMGVSQAHFQGFKRAVDYSGKDTIKFTDLKFFNCYEDLFNAPWSAIGGLLAIEIIGCHFSHGRHDSSALTINEGFAEVTIARCSFNLGSNSKATGITALRQIVLYCNQPSGAFQPGEVVQGQSSNAAMRVLDVFRHDHPFRLPQSPFRLIGQDRSGKRFQPGETVVGLKSGAQVQLSNDKRLVTDNPTGKTLTIGPGLHFESGRGADGAYGVRVLDLAGRGRPLLNLNLDVGSLGINGGGSVGVDLNAKYARISGRFAQSKNKGTPLRLGPRCEKIHIGEPTFFSTGSIDRSCPRREITFDAPTEFYEKRVLPSFNRLGLADQQFYVLDLSKEMNPYNIGKRGGLHPVSIELAVALTIDPSAADTSRMRIKFRPENLSGNVYEWLAVTFNGAPRGSENERTISVTPDDDGKVILGADVSGLAYLSLSVQSLTW